MKDGPLLKVWNIPPLKFHTVSELFDGAKKQSLRHFSGEHATMQMVAKTKEGWRVLTPVEADRNVIGAALRVVFEDWDVEMYAVTVEAWASPSLAVKPSVAADRTELLMIGAADRSGNKHLGTFEIRRNAKGRPSLGDWDEAENYHSWWMSLLDSAPTEH